MAAGLCRIGILLCGIFGTASAHASSFLDQFIDPTDGQFDTSDWLLTRKGFLPVPVLITEPAVGYGLGAAVVFFHDKGLGAGEKVTEFTKGSERRWVPPSISGVVGGATENDTWFAGAFHRGIWRDDHMRYTGALLYPSINLKFYGRGDESPIEDRGVAYNLTGWLLYQELQLRIDDSNWFAGGRLIYFASDSSFRFGADLPPGVSEIELKSDDIGLGLVGSYDSRDNTFTPNRGSALSLSTMFFTGTGALGNDRQYNLTKATSRVYFPLHQHHTLGWRVDAGHGTDDTPFYALPFVQLRGIPALRYQGQAQLTTEFESRWNVRGRWDGVVFAGVGRADDDLGTLASSENRWAGGAGVRYLTARKLGLYTGVDIARGPEEWAFYIQVGTAWVM